MPLFYHILSIPAKPLICLDAYPPAHRASGEDAVSRCPILQTSDDSFRAHERLVMRRLMDVSSPRIAPVRMLPHALRQRRDTNIPIYIQSPFEQDPPLKTNTVRSRLYEGQPRVAYMVKPVACHPIGFWVTCKDEYIPYGRPTYLPYSPANRVGFSELSGGCFDGPLQPCFALLCHEGAPSPRPAR